MKDKWVNEIWQSCSWLYEVPTCIGQEHEVLTQNRLGSNVSSSLLRSVSSDNWVWRLCLSVLCFRTWGWLQFLTRRVIIIKIKWDSICKVLRTVPVYSKCYESLLLLLSSFFVHWWLALVWNRGCPQEGHAGIQFFSRHDEDVLCLTLRSEAPGVGRGRGGPRYTRS